MFRTCTLIYSLVHELSFFQINMIIQVALNYKHITSLYDIKPMKLNNIGFEPQLHIGGAHAPCTEVPRIS